MKGSIERRGPNSFRLVISDGADGSGKRQKFTRLFKADSFLSESKKQDAADTALSLFISDYKRGLSAQSQGMTVAALWTYWMDNHVKTNCEATSVLYYEGFWPRIEKSIGKMRIDRIQPKHLLSFYKSLGEPGVKKLPKKKKASPENSEADTAKVEEVSASKPETPPKELPKLSPTTVKKYHIVLKNLFNKAVKWRLMDFNPAQNLIPPKAPMKEKQIYDLEMTGKLLSLLEGEDSRHKLMVMLGLTCGLRREEIFGLRWSDLDEEKHEISVCQVRVVAKKIITKTPKTKGSARILSYPAELDSLIKKHGAEEAKKQLRLGEDWKDSDLLFTDWFGNDLHPQSMNNFLWRFCRKHDLPPFQPHMLRHLAATFMTARGTDIKTVSAKLGHSRVNITLDLYGHLLRSAEKRSAEVMGNVLKDARQAAKDAEAKKKAQA